MLAVSTSSAAALTEDGSNSTGTAAATATATANTSTPASTMKRQGYSHRSIEPPPPFFTRWSHPLLDDAPVFTEPAADFATHSQQLLELVEEVYRLRDAYYGGGGSVAENGTSTANPDGAAFDYNSSVSSATQLSSLDYKQRLTAEKNRYLSALVGRVLERLNVLTKPPLKKKKKRSAVAGGKDSSSVCESTNDSKMPSSLSSSSMHLSSTQSEHTFDFSLSNQQKAYYYFLRGHLYNALPIAHPLVEENLAKAIKLDPTLVRAWNSMGEFYWKKGDLGAARNCFESAIAFERNKESLRRLSMVYRQWPGTSADHQQYVEASLTLCKEAVGMDLHDGQSWLILGNAYLNRFFSNTHDPLDMRMALSAYNHAENDERAVNEPDIFHNRAMIYDYLEDFNLARGNYVRAMKLDPTTVGIEQTLDIITTYCKRMVEAIAKKGFVKNKRLAVEVRAIQAETDERCMTLAQAEAGAESSAGKYLRCRVLAPVNVGSGLRRSYIAVDADGATFGLTMYKLGNQESDQIKQFDELWVSEPELRQNTLDFSDKASAKWRSVRVTDPLRVLLNGKPFPSRGLQPVFMTTTASA